MIIRKNEFKVMPWLNGKGSTQQLFIFPEVDFKLKNFLFRLSSATLTQSGPFSAYADYRRWLMLLKGKQIKLLNKTKGEEVNIQTLKQVYKFDGNDEIFCEVSNGGIDLNLIVSNKCKQSSLSLIKQSNKEMSIIQESGYLLLYNIGNCVSIDFEGKKFLLQSGDLFVNECQQLILVRIQSETCINLISATVQLNST